MCLLVLAVFQPHTVVLDKRPLLTCHSPGQSQVYAQILKQSEVCGGLEGGGAGLAYSPALDLLYQDLGLALDYPLYIFSSQLKELDISRKTSYWDRCVCPFG